MPELQCEVYDNILSGLSNSLLGVFSIDLKKIIKKTQMQVNEDINEAKRNIGMTFARQLVLGQLGTSFTMNNNFINNNEGMKESDIENSNDNIISTSTKSNNINEEKKDSTSDDENEKFLEEDEYKLSDDNNNGQINLDQTNINNMEFTIAQKGQKLTTKNILKLGGDFIKNNINDSNYFVVYPNIKQYNIPGYTQGLINQEQYKEI